MTNNQTTTTWVIVIVVVLVIIGLGWWYFAPQPSSTATTQSSEKSITSFTLSGLNPSIDGIIDNSNYTVSLTVPNGTDVTSLTPTIVIPENATISPNSGVAQDFTNPVTYTITAQDGSTQNYKVTVAVATAQ